MIAIAKYFNNCIVPTQGEMIISETGDVALVLSHTMLEVAKKQDSEYSMERFANIYIGEINKANGCVQSTTHMAPT